MGVSRLLDIGRRSLRSLDAAMTVVGQNVANAENEHYVRQRVTFQSDSVTSNGVLVRMPDGTPTALGVSVQKYERLRDDLLFGATVDAHTALGSANEEQHLLQSIEATFPTGEGSLSNVLSDFWDAWSTLADYPTDAGVRQNVLGEAEGLIATLHRIDGDLEALETGTLAKVDAHVDAINDRLQELAELNPQIESARVQGSPDFSAEDRRDQLVQELAEFVPIRAVQDGTKGYTVSIHGMTVVQADRVLAPLKLETSGGTPEIIFDGTDVAFSAPAGNDGKLGAALRTLTDTLPDTRAALDDMATTLVTEVNTLHQSGYGLDGATGRDFFDATTLTAGSLRLSSDVAGNPSAIAASGDAAALGDNSVALDLGALRHQPVMMGGTSSFGEYVADLLGDLGGRVRHVTNQASGQAAVVDHLTALERGVSGVSLDEEMTRLIEYQQAYAATARVIDTAQQMLDTLLAL